MNKSIIIAISLLTVCSPLTFNIDKLAHAAPQKTMDIWDINRSHIVKWTLWSFNSDFQLTDVDAQDEHWVQSGFSAFAEGEYRRISHSSLGHIGFVAGSTYLSRMGLTCRNYVIRVEASQDAFPAMACYQNNSWQYTRSDF